MANFRLQGHTEEHALFCRAVELVELKSDSISLTPLKANIIFKISYFLEVHDISLSKHQSVSE